MTYRASQEFEERTEVQKLKKWKEEDENGGNTEVSEVDIEDEESESLKSEDETEEADDTVWVVSAENKGGFLGPSKESPFGGEGAENDVDGGDEVEVRTDYLEEKGIGHG